MAILGMLFYLRQRGGVWDKVFTFVPIILLCYLLPSLLTSFGIISSKGSNLWPIARDYLLPACLVLMTLSIDLRAIIGLGPKALIMFFTATIGVVLGGPIAILIMAQFAPEVVGGEGPDAVWRGFATLAGSWIGGGANQTAMLEIYGFNPERYTIMVGIDILVANLWMIFLLYGAGNSMPLDRWLKADTAAIERLKVKMESYVAQSERVSKMPDFMIIAAIAFGAVGVSHAVADGVTGIFSSNPDLANSILAAKFFWIVITATTIGLALSFTKAREYEGVGASKLGSVFIYILVAIIGTKMDVFQLSDAPLLFVTGMIWMLFHIGLLLIVAKIIRAPFFFVAVGSKANVGGAASAPIVAGAFHPALAPVGVLLAVLGYAVGTYGAILCAQLMQMVAP